MMYQDCGSEFPGGPSDNKTPSIWLSILIPVYNVEPYLEACLDSVFCKNHDLTGIEVIVVDDASHDRSHHICQEKLRTQQGAFRVISHDYNQGVSAARNSLIKQARGNFFWFIDADDVVLPPSLGRLRYIIETHDPDIILCDYRTDKKARVCTFGGPESKLCRDREVLIRGLFSKRKLHLWSKVFRRSLWNDDFEFPVGKCFEDIAITPKLIARAQSYFYEPEPWVHYSTRSNSIMSSLSKKANHFDDKKNTDLFDSLDSIKFLANDDSINIQEISFYISHYCRKEFTKTAMRIIRSGISRNEWFRISPLINGYYSRFKQVSPISWNDLSREYLRRRRFSSWLKLTVYRLLITEKT